MKAGNLNQLISMFYVYVLQSIKDASTYIGSCEHVHQRLQEHNKGKTKSIKHKLPMKLMYYEMYDTKTEARKRELELKRNGAKRRALYKKIFQ